MGVEAVAGVAFAPEGGRYVRNGRAPARNELITDDRVLFRVDLHSLMRSAFCCVVTQILIQQVVDSATAIRDVSNVFDETQLFVIEKFSTARLNKHFISLLTQIKTLSD